MWYLNLLYEIIKYALGSLFIGIALALLLTFALFWLIRACYPRSTFSALSIITGAVLVILLSYQMISMCGAIGLKWKCDDFETYVNNLIPSEQRAYPVPLSEEEASQIISRALEEFPLMEYYVGGGTFTGHNTANIAHSMAETLDKFLNQFIWEALLWSLLETLLAAAIVVWTIHKSKEMKYRMQDSKSHSRAEERNKQIETKRTHTTRTRHTASSSGF